MGEMEFVLKRFRWLDYARFIGIFLVVFGHTTIPKACFDFIYLFHMPLFFIISGYLFSQKKYSSYWKFVKYKAKHLLIPYLFFSLLTFLFWYFIGRHFGEDTMETFTARDLFDSLIASRMIIYNVVLWFLPALFVTENLYYLFVRILKPIWIFLLFIALAWLYNYSIGVNLPMHANLAIGPVFLVVSRNIKIARSAIYLHMILTGEAGLLSSCSESLSFSVTLCD